MNIPLTFLPELGMSFILVFARLGALVMLFPGFGETNVPARIRLGLALLLTLLMLPLVRAQFGAMPTQMAGLFLLLGQEILIGLFIGMVVKFVSSTLQTAGALIAQQTGLGFVTQIDPTQGGQNALIGNFLSLLGIVLFFTSDLHHLAIRAIHDSYGLFSPGGAIPMGDFTDVAVKTMSRSFVIAIQISAPFLVLGTVFQVAIGVLSRLMPQLQIMFITMPLQIIGGFTLIAALLVTLMGWYIGHMEQTIGQFLNR